MYQLNERLRNLRLQNNISQNALAKQMDLTRATINAWEMGISYPNAQSLILLSNYFNVSVDYILGLDDKQMLDISQLTNDEKRMINEIVNHFINLKNKTY